jgi:hypothetical protein
MHVHVFTIDMLPLDGCVASGGGLRSRQMVRGLQRLGAEVTYSMPAAAPLVRQQWDRLTLEQRDNCISHEKGKRFLDIINRFKPDATLILQPTVFSSIKDLKTGMISVLDINGFQNIEAVGLLDSRNSFDQETRGYLQQIDRADILITGSPEQRAYWGGLLGYHRNTLAAAEMIDVPFCLDPEIIDAAAAKSYDGAGPLFICSGTFLPWNSPQGYMIRLVEMIARAGHGELLVVGHPHLLQPYAGQVLRELEAVAQFPFARVRQGMPFSSLVEAIARRGIAVDLHLPTFERQFALPVRTMTHLGLGNPVIFNDYSTLARRIARYGAGFCVDPAEPREFEAVVEEILFDRQGDTLTRMSNQAIELIRENYYGDACMERLLGSMEEQLTKSRARRRMDADARASTSNNQPQPDGLLSPFIKKLNLPRVLVISDDFENMLELRVHLPFRTMREQQLIDDYVLLSLGELVRRADRSDSLRDIDVVWVQRRPTNALFPVNMFGENFILDVDDNLLISPAYRSPFDDEWVAMMRMLLRSAGTVTTTGPRLVDAIQRAAGLMIEHKVVFAPNMTGSVHKKDIVRPSALLLACSDRLPLTHSRTTFLQAVKRFTELRELPVIYLGAEFSEDAKGMAREVHEIRVLPYRRYLHFLRSEPLMAVAPLEAHGDPLTDDFICSKSDIKMVEYGGASVPAVYSHAPPYSDSPLECGALVDFSDGHALVNALDAVFNNAHLEARRAYESVQEQRLASIVVRQWHEAIERQRMSHPMSLEMIEAQASSYRSYLADSFPTPVQFDASSYVEAYPDAAEWAKSTGNTVYDHYLKIGQPEGRRWHVGDPGYSVERTAYYAKGLVLTIDHDLRRLGDRVAAALSKVKQ